MEKSIDKEILECVEERDKALKAFVMHEDFSAVITYCLNYGIAIPSNLEVLKLGMWKAVLEITSMPKEVKDKAQERINQWRKEHDNNGHTR